jgi:hypothetical protein
LIIYLTYNEQPSGIYNSQVVDVVKFLNHELKADIRLVSLISLRGYLKNRRLIKGRLKNAIVLPMIPKLVNWRLNNFLLFLISIRLKPQAIIGRSVLATHLALTLKNKGWCKHVIYDGRGAIAAEWNEYNVIQDKTLKRIITQLEYQAVKTADFRLSVSNALIKYWRDSYNYCENKHVVIPCTLNDEFANIQFTEENIISARRKMGFDSENVVLIYSGSTAEWQSLEIMADFIDRQLTNYSNIRMIFLTDPNPVISELMQKFPEKVKRFKVKSEEVMMYLMSADYGLLIREQSVTNRVASPVKFAEYLACGLKVIISENIGDYSKFLVSNGYGFVIDNSVHQLIRQDFKERLSVSVEAKLVFSKSAYRDAYNAVLKAG